MQLRYLGDAVDFGKYNLLRHLSGHQGEDKFPKYRIGVNWYLSKPEEVGDAGNTHGSRKGDVVLFEGIDADLASKLAIFNKPSRQTFKVFRNAGIFPDETLFHEEVLALAELEKRDAKLRRRTAWHGKALATLETADLILLDPDTGLEIESVTRTAKTGPKYAFLDEVSDYVANEQTVVITQFPRREGNIALFASQTICRLQELTNFDTEVVAVKYEAKPAMLFLLVIARSHRKVITARLKDLSRKSSELFSRIDPAMTFS